MVGGKKVALVLLSAFIVCEMVMISFRTDLLASSNAYFQKWNRIPGAWFNLFDASNDPSTHLVADKTALEKSMDDMMYPAEMKMKVFNMYDSNWKEIASKVDEVFPKTRRQN